MEDVKGILKSIGFIAIVLISVAIYAIITTGIGYLLGMYVAIIPVASDVLTAGIGLTEEQIPTVMAWMTMAVSLLFALEMAAAVRGGDEK